MSAPNVSMTVQPSVGGSLVYLPMGPSTKGGKPRGRLLVELKMTNNSSANLTATKLSISFPGSSAGTGTPSTRPMNQMFQPFQKIDWSMASGADHYIFDLVAAPSTAVVSVSFAGFSDPITLTTPIAAHVNPVAGGAYHFPSVATDLRLGEFWQMNGCSHNPGNHQAYGYDMAIWGIQHDTGVYSALTNGKDPDTIKAPNEDYRIFGKPVRAMADGEVVAIVNNCPNNSTPLYAETTAELDALLLLQQSTWLGFPNGEAGNHVYVRHGNEIMLYAHLQKGSIDGAFVTPKPASPGHPAVKGSTVTRGQFLGSAGNSGNSSAPHLHIHASTEPFGSGAGRPILLTEAWTIDNDVVMGAGDPPTLQGEPGGSWSQLAGRGIPEGSAKTGESGVGDSFLLPAGTPAWPEVVKLAVEENDYQGVFNSMAAKGMKPVWINAYTIDKGPFYFYTFFNAVFRPSLGADQPSFHGMDAATYQNTYNSMLGKGYHLVQVESYFSFRQDKQLFAAIFGRYGGLKPLKDSRAYHAQTHGQHRAFFSAWTAEGFVPRNLSVVSVKGQLSYTALYDYVGSAVTGLEADESMTAPTLQTKFDNHFQNGSFLTYLKGYIHQGQTRYSGVWYHGGSKGKVRSDQREAAFEATVSGQRRGNHLIRSVTGYQLDGDVAFGGMWNA